jgi:sodium-dependent dicarboxylate transporter 2/3/5
LPPGELGHADEFVATLRAFCDPTLGLFLGGLGLAAAIERWNLHRRVALFALSHVGSTPPRLVFGVVSVTACLSLWISNTATAALMLPIALALVREIERHAGGGRRERFGGALMLAVAYGANIGGLGTKIGTAPNSQLASFLETRADLPVSFASFAALGLPLVIVLVPIASWILWRNGRSDAPETTPGADLVRRERLALGPWSAQERAVALVFGATAAAWTVSAPIARLVGELTDRPAPRSTHVEVIIALTAAAVLLAWSPRGARLLDGRALRTLAWSTLLLLGGSLALAAAVQSSGLAETLARSASALTGFAPLPRLVCVALAAVVCSAAASNTATAAVLLNVLWSALPADQAPAALFTATFAASCDFALPVGTPPNALVFGTGYVRVARMARVGFVLDIVAALVTAVWCWLAVDAVL